MGFLASIFLKLFTGSTLNFVSKIITSMTSEHVAEVQAQTGLDATEATAVVQAEIARYSAVKDVQISAMSHPIWWWAWALFVFPVGLYMASIYMLSLGCAFAVDHHACAAAWTILEVPKEIESWGFTVVTSIFGIYGVSSVVTTIANRLGKAAA
jgi:hypothetical protein